jgi:hypothetical protein
MDRRGLSGSAPAVAPVRRAPRRRGTRGGPSAPRRPTRSRPGWTTRCSPPGRRPPDGAGWRAGRRSPPGPRGHAPPRAARRESAGAQERRGARWAEARSRPGRCTAPVVARVSPGPRTPAACATRASATRHHRASASTAHPTGASRHEAPDVPRLGGRTIPPGAAPALGPAVARGSPAAPAPRPVACAQAESPPVVVSQATSTVSGPRCGSRGVCHVSSSCDSRTRRAEQASGLASRAGFVHGST